MTDKTNRPPSIAWIKMTGYIRDWLKYEFGGRAQVNGVPVICIQHLRGARDVLRMETETDVMDRDEPEQSISAAKYSCIDAALRIDTGTVERLYSMTREELAQYVPVECPRLCMTQDGVLRPWTDNVRFGQRQAAALQRLVREAFWEAVREYDQDYALAAEGKRYAAIDMIEAFCKDTGTRDTYVEEIRREWQRRVKREDH